MLKIAYCDDCQDDRAIIMANLSQIEEKWKDHFEIEGFKSGVDLCQKLEKNNYDIILLDIMMDHLNGIETAKRIRSSGEDSKIIFISSYDEKIRELFQVGTIAFLDKPLRSELLEDALKRAYDLIKKDNEKIFIYEKNGSKYFIPINEIMYFEANRNQVKIQMKKTSIMYLGTLKNVWTKVKQNENFIMANKSYIFNLKYIILKSNKVLLNDHCSEVNIGRIYKEETYNRYFNYIGKRSE